MLGRKQVWIHFNGNILYQLHSQPQLIKPAISNKITRNNPFYYCPVDCLAVSDSLRPQGLQHARLLCRPPSPRACSNSCHLSQWCYLIISSSVVPFFFCLQSFPASGSFPMSQFFTSGGQSIHLQHQPRSFIFSISLSNKYSGLISFRIDWLDLHAVQVFF